MCLASINRFPRFSLPPLPPAARGLARSGFRHRYGSFFPSLLHTSHGLVSFLALSLRIRVHVRVYESNLGPRSCNAVAS